MTKLHMDLLQAKTQTDIIILLENVRCQTSDSACQRQAFVTLAGILNLDEDCQNYFREAGGVEEITKWMLDDEYEQSVIPVALFCLASAIEGNETSKLDVLSRDVLLHIHKLFVSVQNQECLQSVAFFLACLINGNGKAQHLAHRTGCVEDLLQILRKLVQDECVDETLWNMMTRSVSACISNPQNENNQRISSCMIPHLLKVITDWSDGSIVQLAMTTIRSLMNNNGRGPKIRNLSPSLFNEPILFPYTKFISCGSVSNQTLFRSCGGIDTLSCLITKHVARFDKDESGYDVLMSAIHTMDSAVAENKENAAHAVRLGLLPQVLSLLQRFQQGGLDSNLSLMVLAHILELVDYPVGSAFATQCQNEIAKLLTDPGLDQQDEKLKLINYIQELCIAEDVDREDERQPKPPKEDIRHDRSIGFQQVINGKTDKLHCGKPSASPIGELDYNNNACDNGQAQHATQSICSGLNEINDFINGRQNDNSEVPTMLAVMALQDKQIQVFSQIQNLISSLTPSNKDGNAYPLQQMTKENCQHSSTHSVAKSRPVLKQPFSTQPCFINNHSKSFQKSVHADKDDIFESREKQNSSHYENIQNVSRILNASICKSKKGKMKDVVKPPSKENVRNDRIARPDKNHQRSQTVGSKRSVASSSIFSDSIFSDSIFKDATKPESRASKGRNSVNAMLQTKTHDRNPGNNEYDSVDDDNGTNSSTSTVSNSHSITSTRLLRNHDVNFSRDQGNRKAHDKKTHSIIHALKNCKDKIFLENPNKVMSYPDSKPDQLKDGGNQTISKHIKGSQNVRQVKTIRSIEVASQPSVFGEGSTSLCPHVSSSRRYLERQIPKVNENTNLHASFEGAVRSLSVSAKERKASCMNKSDAARYRSDSVNRESLGQSRKRTPQDIDSGFGYDSNHDSKKKGFCDNSSCKTVDLHENRIRTKRDCVRGIEQQVSNMKNISEKKESDKRADISHGLLEDQNQDDRKEKDNFVVPSSYVFTPQSLQSFTRNIRKRMPSATIDDRKQETASICSGFKKPYRQDMQEGETKDGKIKLLKKVKDRDLKECKDVYDFTSASEMVVSQLTPKSEMSARSTRRCIKKRSHNQSADCSTPRRPRVPYSDQEILNLRHGVSTLGTRWQQIIAVYQFHPSRTAVDLKEKFKRLMEPPKSESNKRDKKCETLPFSSDELRRLTRGVRMFGHNWKAILAGEKFLPGRTHQDLRDKWTSMSRMLFRECNGTESQA